MLALTFKSLLSTQVHLISEPVIDGITMTISDVDDLNDESKIKSLIETKHINTVKLTGESISSIPTYECFKLLETFIIEAEKITNIPAYLFYQSQSIRTVTLSQQVLYIYKYAFYNSSIQTINLDSVSLIMKLAFYHCINLQSVSLDYRLETEPYAFGYCSNLNSISIGSGYYLPDDTAFYGVGIKHYEFNMNIGLHPDKLIDSSLETLTIGELFNEFELETSLKNLKLIIFQEWPGSISISNQPNLEEIRFPSSDPSSTKDYKFKSNPKLVNIDTSKFDIFHENAFTDCISLESVDISNAHKIGYFSFSGCSNLRELIGFNSEHQIQILTNAFHKCYKLKFTYYDGNHITLQSYDSYNGLCYTGSEELEIRSFTDQPKIIGMPHLKKVVFDESCTFNSIKSNSFVDCPLLQEIVLNSKITTLEEKSFRNLNLTKFDLKNVNAIDINAFINSGMRELIINQDFTFPIGELSTEASLSHHYFLYNEPNLEKVTLKQGVTKIYLQNIKSSHPFTYELPENSAFSIQGNFLYSGDSKILEAVLSSEQTKIEIPDSVYIIRPYAFSSAQNLEEVTIGSNVKSFYRVFTNCKNLKKITIRSPITAFQSQMFENCTELTTIEVSRPITYIGDSCFYGCEKLQLISQNNIETLSKKAFMNCKAINTINLQNVKFIPEYCFSGCGSINLRNLSSLVEIDYYAFSDSDMTSFTCPSSLKMIQSFAFMNCRKLQSFIIGEGMTRIEEGVFRNTSLETIRIPSNIEYIHNEAFTYSLNIKFTFPDGGHPLFDAIDLFFYNKVTKELIFVFGRTNNPNIVLPNKIDTISETSLTTNHLTILNGRFWESFEVLIIPEKIKTYGKFYSNVCFQGVRSTNNQAIYSDSYFDGSHWIEQDTCDKIRQLYFFGLSNFEKKGLFPPQYIFQYPIYEDHQTLDTPADQNNAIINNDMQQSMHSWLDDSYDLISVVLLITVSVMLVVIVSLFTILSRY